MQRYLRIAAPVLVAMFVLVVSACDSWRPAAAPPLATKRATVSVPIDVRADADGTDRYRYEIRYPALPPRDATLAAAMRAFGERQKRDFLANFGEEVARPEGASFPWAMHLAFELRAQNADFVSVLATGDAYSGGAHGNPLLASFVLHRRSGRVLALPELFANADAGLRALAAETRLVLRERLRDSGGDEQRIDDGTAPKAENYSVFLVDVDAGGAAKGVIVIFPAYQVASYAQGPQQVAVPAARFRDLLRPEFRKAFAATAAK